MPDTLVPSALDRRQVQFADGTTGRVYDHDSLSRPVPSVTTVGDLRVDPDKDDAIAGWKEQYDGSKPWRAPHWKEQRYFKRHRGTLIHWVCLHQFGVERTADEDKSERILKHWGEERPAVTDDETIPVYGPFDEYDGEDPWTAVLRDTDWAQSAFDEVCTDYGITDEGVVAAEEYVVDEDYGYAGQVDLVFENDDGDVVVADIKTGSGVRDSVKYQLAAYAHALDRDVDRLMVIRLYPDDEEVEVQTDADWPNTIDGYQHHFLSLAERFNATKFPVTPTDDA